MIHNIIYTIIDIINQTGYFGIFFLMFLESGLFPVPSEAVIIPAGYLAFQGKMNIYMVIFMGTAGSLAGALFNYYIAFFLGRMFLIRHGKYVFIKERSIHKVEKFFEKYGDLSVFIGRLLPVIRHLISLPAGLAKMNVVHFSVYTTVGALIWVSILGILGFFFGQNQDMIEKFQHEITMLIVLACLFIVAAYALYKYKGRYRY